MSADDCLLDGAWVGPVACTTRNDNLYGLVQITAVGQAPAGIIGLVWIFAPEVNGSVGSRIETIGPERTTLPSTAARFSSGPFVLPPVPLSPLVDLVYAFRQQTLTACQARRA